jgi:hypothetical protein
MSVIRTEYIADSTVTIVLSAAARTAGGMWIGSSRVVNARRKIVCRTVLIGILMLPPVQAAILPEALQS